jgi:hypothetical protein
VRELKADTPSVTSGTHTLRAVADINGHSRPPHPRIDIYFNGAEKVHPVIQSTLLSFWIVIVKYAHIMIP